MSARVRGARRFARLVATLATAIDGETTVQPIAHRDVIRPEAFAPPPPPVDDEDPTTFHLQLDAQAAELSYALHARARSRRVVARVGGAVLVLVLALLVTVALGVVPTDHETAATGPARIAVLVGLGITASMVACALCVLPPRERAWLDRAVVIAVGTGAIALASLVAQLVQGAGVGLDLLVGLVVAAAIAAVLAPVTRSATSAARPTSAALLNPRRDPWPSHDRPDRRALALRRVLAWATAYTRSRARVRTAGEHAAWSAATGVLAIAALIAGAADLVADAAAASASAGASVGAASVGAASVGLVPSGLPVSVIVLELATAVALIAVAWWIGATPVGADAGPRVQQMSPARLTAIRAILVGVVATVSALAVVGVSDEAARAAGEGSVALRLSWGHVYQVAILLASSGLLVAARKIVVAAETWLPRPNPADLIVGLTIPDADLRARALASLREITGVESSSYNDTPDGIARWHTWLGDVALRLDLVGTEWPPCSRVAVPKPRGIV